MSNVVSTVNTNLTDVNYNTAASSIFNTRTTTEQRDRSVTDAVFRSVNGTTATLGGRGTSPSNYATSVNVGMRRVNASITERITGGEAPSSGTGTTEVSGTLTEDNFSSGSSYSVSQSAIIS